MINKTISIWILVLVILCMTSPINQAAGQQDPLVGKQTVNFTLSSTEDRAINYGSEYYDKAFLIVTFFPAAYTPV